MASPVKTPGRLWRPQAQRKVRNAFSAFSAARANWEAASGRGLTAATAVVNAFLNEGYMDNMDIGALTDMSGIRLKAKEKLRRQQEVHLMQMVAAYNDLVAAVEVAEEAAASVRGLSDLSSAPAATPSPGSTNTTVDWRVDRETLVFRALPLGAFELWAKEITGMLQDELHIKSLIAAAFQSLLFPRCSGMEFVEGTTHPAGTAFANILTSEAKDSGEKNWQKDQVGWMDESKGLLYPGSGLDRDRDPHGNTSNDLSAADKGCRESEAGSKEESSTTVLYNKDDSEGEPSRHRFGDSGRPPAARPMQQEKIAVCSAASMEGPYEPTSRGRYSNSGLWRQSSREQSTPISGNHCEKNSGGAQIPETLMAKPPSRDNLQVYLTAWLAEVHVDKPRLREILAMASEEMRSS